jgi:transposase-like protein
MPPRREFGTEISGNRRRGPNLTPDERQRIIAKRQCGVQISELAAEFGRSVSAIKYTIKTYANRATTQERPRSRRPPMLSDRTKRLIHRKVRAQPKIQYSELAEVAKVYPPTGPPSRLPSHSTLYEEIRRTGLRNVRC